MALKFLLVNQNGINGTGYRCRGTKKRFDEEEREIDILNCSLILWLYNVLN
jgi:hypothetical protein